jgi:outer membrane receptor protein involved in Fe transport
MNDQHQPASHFLNCKLKPISIIVFLICAQSSYAQDLNAANSIDAITGEPSKTAKPIDVPSVATQYGATKKTLLAADVKDTKQAGTGKTDSQGKPIDKPVEIELNAVNVRAKRFYQIGPLPGLALTKEEIPGNVQSISAKEIKESHAISLTELMNSKLQSVNVNDYQSNPFQMDVTYRGFTASPQLGTAQGLSVFLDGIRVNEPFGDVVNWDMLPLNALAGIDLIPGSNPIFGLGTLGGAITMRTKSGFDSNEGTVEALGGSFNRKQFQGSIGGNNGVIAGFAAANIFSEDGWRDDSPSKVNQVFGKAEWRNENLQFGLSALYAGNKLTGNGLLPTEMAQQDRSQVFTSADETKNKLLQFQLTGQWDVSDTFNITGQVYKRKSKRNSRTGDVNEDFSGSATKRPNAGERTASYVPDLDNDGLPDMDPTLSNTYNIAQATVLYPDGSSTVTNLDANGNPEILSFTYVQVGVDQDGNPQFDNVANLNSAFDANNLAIGTNGNTTLFANQATETYTKADGTTATRPVWGYNPTALTSAPAFNSEYYQQALAIFKARSVPTKAKMQDQLIATGQDFSVDTNGASYAYYDVNGFLVGGAVNSTPALDANGHAVLQLYSGSGPGLGKPLGVMEVDPITGKQIQRNGADCDQFSSPTGQLGQCAGYIPGTPVALITETEIDQTTDGGALQLNWNLEHHKFMVGASIDASDASYTSGQYLGLFDNKRKAYLDPANVGYEFAAASKKIGLNDFAGDSNTKSVYFSETWTPKKELAFTAAGRYNVTHIKNELAINNYLGLAGPTAFKNFPEDLVLCKDLNGNSTIEPDTECPLGEMRPFSLELAQGLGAIRTGETEKFSYYSFNPSLGGTWQPNEALNVYANWSKGARTPSVIELGCAFDDTPVITYAQDGTVISTPRTLSQRRFCSLPSTLSGDPYLKQVRSETIEVGARGYVTPDIQWNVSAYNTDLKDDIYFVSFRPERSFFTNIGNTRRRGIEMGLQGKSGKAGFRLNYSLTDATFQDNFTVASPNNSSAGNTALAGGAQIPVQPGDRMPGVPLHNLNATLSYDITPDWTVGLTGVLHSESFIRGNENNKHKAGVPNYQYSCSIASSPTMIGGVAYGNDTCEGKTLLPSARFAGIVPGYAVFNFNTAYKITKGLTAALQITNLFDRTYYSAGRLGTNAFSPSVNGAIGAGGFNYNSNDWLSTTFLAPGAPRSAYMSLTYDFDMGGK